MYEEEISASDFIRVEQAQELEGYLALLRADQSALASVFHPDFTSPQAYARSAAGLRQRLRETLGYPPPGECPGEPPEFNRIAEDETAVYYRTRFAVLPGVHVVGLFLVPQGISGRIPLVISMHGGGGSPEVATFQGGANYHDLVRGAVAQGYAVWAPQHLYLAQGYGEDLRQRVDSRARLVGTTITAIEIAKISRGLDSILVRPEIDPKRVAMVGLSYGGFYTLYATALEPRIGVAVSSCYFSDRREWFDRAEPLGWSDWRFSHGLSLFRDPEIIALICPRPVQIQVGETDEGFPVEWARQTAPAAAAYYERLGRPADFEFSVFDGGHEFHGGLAWDFLSRHLSD